MQRQNLSDKSHRCDRHSFAWSRRLGAPREALWPSHHGMGKKVLCDLPNSRMHVARKTKTFPLYSFILLLISLDPSQLLHNLSKRPPNVQPQLQTLTEYGQCCPQHWDPLHLPTDSSPLKDLHLGAQVGWHPSVAQWWKWLLIHSPCFSEKLWIPRVLLHIPTTWFFFHLHKHKWVRFWRGAPGPYWIGRWRLNLEGTLRACNFRHTIQPCSELKRKRTPFHWGEAFI